MQVSQCFLMLEQTFSVSKIIILKYFCHCCSSPLVLIIKKSSWPFNTLKIIKKSLFNTHNFLGLSFIQLKVESKEDSMCGLISVQPPSCPISYSGDDVAKRSWQTILSIAAYTIKVEDYPNGFVVSFLTLKG